MKLPGILMKDNGALAVLKMAHSSFVFDIGVIGPKAKVVHKGATVAAIASWNHFGTKDAGGHTPSRPFLTLWFEENKDANQKLVARVTALYLKGKITKEQALKLCGEKFVGGVKKKIASNIGPINAPSTLARKAPKTKTLIVNGTMRSAVSYRLIK